MFFVLCFLQDNYIVPVDNDDDNYIEPTEGSAPLPVKREFQMFKLVVYYFVRNNSGEKNESNLCVFSIQGVEVQLLKNLETGSWLLWPVTRPQKLYTILASLTQ